MRTRLHHVQRLIPIATLALVLGGVTVAAATQKVRICHFPPGNSGKVQLLSVGGPAAWAHLSNHDDAVCKGDAHDCCPGTLGGTHGHEGDRRCGQQDHHGEHHDGEHHDGNRGVCTDLQTDASNCGACGNECAQGAVCTGGTCVCPSGQIACGDVCLDPSSDPNNCGACGTVCPAGDTCEGGVCVSPCQPGQVSCGGTCVDPSSDPNNCGSCGIVCPVGDDCENGACVSPCVGGEVSCGGTCVDLNTDPNDCGSCGTVCPTDDTCAVGTCVPPAVGGACLPTSSLALLIQGTDVSAYVPNGSWAETTPDVQLVPLEGAGSRATISTAGVPVNSCSSNSLTGETVCTGNSNDVYLITGSTLNTTLAAGSDGTSQSFSGGLCQTCGVAVNSGNNTAVISVGFAGAGAFQTLDLSTSTFAPPIPANGQMTSEDISVDPARHFVLSPNEVNNYQIVDTLTSAVFDFDLSNVVQAGGELDSAGEDCATGIALSTIEFTNGIFLADLTQATFTPGSPGTWSAPSQVQSLPEFSALTAGTSGIAVAPGSHLAIVTGEFGGDAFGAIQLPSTSGSGTPALVDWVVANVPAEPTTGLSFSLGLDPHTVSAYSSPNSGKAIGVMADDPRAFLALVDLQALLAAPRSGPHTVDPIVDLVGSGIVTFVSIF